MTFDPIDPALITRLANEVRDVVVGPELAHALRLAREVKREAAILNERLDAWQRGDLESLVTISMDIDALERVANDPRNPEIAALNRRKKNALLTGFPTLSAPEPKFDGWRWHVTP